MTAEKAIELFQKGSPVAWRFGRICKRYQCIYSIARKKGEDGRIHYYCTLMERGGTIAENTKIEPCYLEGCDNDDERISVEEIYNAKEEYKNRLTAQKRARLKEEEKNDTKY